MDSVIIGAASGFLVASVAVCAGELMLFNIVKDPPAELQPLIDRLRPEVLAMSIVILMFPFWGVVGVAMGLLYEISVSEVPGPGLGSPNLAFTVAVTVATVLLAAPMVVLLRKVMIGVLVIVGVVIALFGWFLPHMAN